MISTTGFFGSLSRSLYSFPQHCLGSTAYLNGVHGSAGGGLWLRLSRFRPRGRGFCRMPGLGCACGCRVGLGCTCYSTDHLGGPYRLLQCYRLQRENLQFFCRRLDDPTISGVSSLALIENASVLSRLPSSTPRLGPKNAKPTCTD